MKSPATIRINRAPVLTLWAAVLAERLGMPREAALTVGQALAGLTARAKGVRLGIYAPPEQRPHEPSPVPTGVKNVRDIHLNKLNVKYGCVAWAAPHPLTLRYQADEPRALDPACRSMEAVGAQASPRIGAVDVVLEKRMRPPGMQSSKEAFGRLLHD